MALKIHVALRGFHAALDNNINFKNFRQKAIKILSDADLQTQKLSPKAQILSSATHSKLSTPNTLLPSFPNATPCFRHTFIIRTSGHCLPSFRIVNIFCFSFPHNNNNNNNTECSPSHCISLFLLSFLSSFESSSNICYTIKGCKNDYCVKCRLGAAHKQKIIQT